VKQSTRPRRGSQSSRNPRISQRSRARRVHRRLRNRTRRPRTHRVQRHQIQPLLWPEDSAYRPVFRNRQVRLHVQQRGQTTPYGGLALAHDLAMRLQLDREINRALPLLKLKLPYFESDHFLTHVYNQYVGGTCLEDISNLQHSAAIKGLVGACRIPDPSTAGDFLRRFRPAHLRAVQRVIDQAREKVWSKLPRSRRRVATIDLDSTIKPVYGECKQGADFSYNGQWSYHPLLITLMETNEPLRTINRSGNAASADGAAAALLEVLPMVKRHFDTVYVRGDSKFYQKGILAACARHDVRFALCLDGYAGLQEKAYSLPLSEWEPFSAHRADQVARAAAEKQRRRKRRRYRPLRARQRGYETLTTVKQWVTQFDYTIPPGGTTLGAQVVGNTYRVAVKQQEVETHQGQEYLFSEYRNRFVITDIPPAEMNAAEVICFAYGRCDQENTIEQFKNGIAALRMPTGELLANSAFLLAGQLAWCLRAWLSLLALPKETTRWEWKWFRQAFVYVAARVTRGARQVHVFLADGHRFVEHLLLAAQRLQSFVFEPSPALEFQ